MANRTTTDLLVLHCSATRPSQDIDRATIEAWHKAKGWSAIGYHFVIKRDGTLQLGRPLEEIGAHVEGFNSHSVGICMVGGLDEAGVGLINDRSGFTAAQWVTAHTLIPMLLKIWPAARIVGHRDLSPDVDGDGSVEQREWLKTCPGFDAATEFRL